MPVSRRLRALVPVVATVLSLASPASAAPEEVADSAHRSPAPSAPRPERPAPFFRLGAGYSTGELFLGDPASRSLRQVPILFDAGVAVSKHLAAGGGILVAPGRSTERMTMGRLAIGGQIEVRLGPVTLAGGPHVTGFAAWRKSEGSPGRYYDDAADVLWRLGAGAHAALFVEAPVAGRAAVFAGLRGDIDVLVTLGETSRSLGTAAAVGGLTF